ncbi:MAG: hypothetical protein LLG15_03955 [Betaproteobacteria bacterium]|nr:hypothetical protein [Betaproteobacteria bacterium]
MPQHKVAEGFQGFSAKAANEKSPAPSARSGAKRVIAHTSQWLCGGQDEKSPSQGWAEKQKAKMRLFERRTLV